LTSIRKIESILDAKEHAAIQGQMEALNGILALKAAKFELAAKHFLAVPFAFVDQLSEVYLCFILG
jgi:hypothetical protein